MHCTYNCTIVLIIIQVTVCLHYTLVYYNNSMFELKSRLCKVCYSHVYYKKRLLKTLRRDDDDDDMVSSWLSTGQQLINKIANSWLNILPSLTTT